jgi:ABC-type uncharacterized transport system ATPase subunit
MVLSARAADISEAELARAMFPDDATSEVRMSAKTLGGDVIAELRGVDLHDRHGVTRVRGATLAVHAREIVGIAGVEGSGHHELLLMLAGRLRAVSGDVRIPSDIAFIPEHRQRDALVSAFSLAENVALRGASRARGRLDWSAVARRTRELVRQHGIHAASVKAPVRTLSGGNQQRLVLARELDGAPLLVVAENPTQGLDVRAAAAIRARLRAARDAGAAVVVYASDLDELTALADRVVVTFGGTVREVRGDAEAIGRAMLGALT